MCKRAEEARCVMLMVVPPPGQDEEGVGYELPTFQPVTDSKSVMGGEQN